MTAQRITNGLALTTVVGAALLLSGCGNSPAPAASAPTSATASPQSPQGTTAPASQAAPAPEPPVASAVPTAPQAGPALCKSGNLQAATGAAGGGAAGSVYLQLILTNSGTEPCLLRGYAGVSLTADANGNPIGAAAARDTSTPVADVLLAPGAAGAATLRYTQASNYSDCTRTPAAGFRIYPPEDTASLFVADPRDACGNAGISLLTISSFQAK